MFNKFAPPDVEEEKARMKALVDNFMNDEGEKEEGEDETEEN